MAYCKTYLLQTDLIKIKKVLDDSIKNTPDAEVKSISTKIEGILLDIEKLKEKYKYHYGDAVGLPIEYGEYLQPVCLDIGVEKYGT